jgi:hypothetical protein
VSVIYGYAENIARQHIARKLKPLKVALHRPGQSMGEGGFAYPGDILN